MGFYYGYDAGGRSEWRLFSGTLTRSEQPGVQWELVTPLLQFKNGSCIGCAYQPPEDPIEGAIIRLEFQQRNYLRLTIGDNPSQFYVPIIYGSTGHKFFSEQTPYLFPDYGADFVFITKPNADPPEPWNWRTEIVQIEKGRFAEGGPHAGELVYDILVFDGPDLEPVPIGSIESVLEPASGQPGCTIIINGSEYVMPIGQLSDSRFFGEAQDGSTVEGFRLFYDLVTASYVAEGGCATCGVQCLLCVRPQALKKAEIRIGSRLLPQGILHF